MKILFLGDVVGRSGRTALSSHLPDIINKLNVEFVIANCENATSGLGLSTSHAKEIFETGVDCITLGDHSFDQKDMLSFIEQENRIIRPLNFAKSAPGTGSRIFLSRLGKRILVIQVLGQVFMKRTYSDPFSHLDNALRKTKLGDQVDAIVIDVHAEATSEKMALGHWCDGRASLIIGTHTHIPTSDLQIFEKGSAYQTDAGMCGNYDSVIGMDKFEPISRFVTGMTKERFSPAKGEATLCGVIIQTDKTGYPYKVRPFRYGGRLIQSTDSKEKSQK